MPFELAYSEPAQFKVRASGEVTLAEIADLVSDMLAHPGSTAGFDVLVVADEVNAVPSTSELRIVATDHLVPMMRRGLGALAIVAPKPFIYGVARVFGVFAESVGGKVGTFREVDGARDWLAKRRTPAS